MNAEHDELLNIEGPMCVCPGPCGMFDQEFKVSTLFLSKKIFFSIEFESDFVKNPFGCRNILIERVEILP